MPSTSPSQLRLRYPLFVTFAAALYRRSIGLFGIGIIVAARRAHRTQTLPSAFGTPSAI
ncbi:hypothetical protein C8Q74DRAFT_1293772 [Fomes fomentarius]|nr:hypothetical protein C8Q74DRAFT_1293772 [Fomes fomentarius]